MAAYKYQLQVGITGRVGSGILYPNFYVDRSDIPKMLQLIPSLAQAVSTLGGFFMVEGGRLEVRQAYDIVSERCDYRFMQQLKLIFDPKNIFNPGKVVQIL